MAQHTDKWRALVYSGDFGFYKIRGTSCLASQGFRQIDRQVDRQTDRYIGRYVGRDRLRR